MSCPECGGFELIDDKQSGDCICTSCGLVVQDHAWDTRTYDGEPLRECLTQQVIGNCPQRLVQAGSDNSKLRSLLATTSHLRKVAGDLMLTEGIILTATRSWEQINAKHICRGEVRVALEAACTYYSCKLAGFARSKQVIAAGFGLSTCALKKGMKVYSQVLRPSQGDVVLMCSPTNSNDILASCVSAVCGLLVPMELERIFLAETRKIDADVRGSGVLEGKTPVVSAAAAISIAMLRRQLAGREKLPEYLPVSPYTLSRTIALIRNHTNII